MSKNLILICLISWLTFDTSASVVVTTFDPPLPISAYADAPQLLSVDFNVDGRMDINFAFGDGGIEAYFNYPAQIVVQNGSPANSGGQPVPGSLGALPLGTVIGSNLVSSLDVSNYAWFAGWTNTYDLTQLYGNRENEVMIVVNDGIVGDPPVAGGDVVGKEGAIAVQFYINGQPHFGYIHFDFRPQHGGYPAGTAGYIYGWAYETQPNTPIVANSIGTLPIDDCKIVNFTPRIETNDTFIITWNAVAGGTYHVEASTNLATWTDISGDIIANLDYMNFTTPSPPMPAPQCFFRVHRVN